MATVYARIEKFYDLNPSTPSLSRTKYSKIHHRIKRIYDHKKGRRKFKYTIIEQRLVSPGTYEVRDYPETFVGVIDAEIQKSLQSPVSK